MVQPTALNAIIIFLSVVIMSFVWRMAAGWLVDRNPDSPLGKGMASAFN